MCYFLPWTYNTSLIQSHSDLPPWCLPKEEADFNTRKHSRNRQSTIDLTTSPGSTTPSQSVACPAYIFDEGYYYLCISFCPPLPLPFHNPCQLLAMTFQNTECVTFYHEHTTPVSYSDLPPWCLPEEEAGFNTRRKHSRNCQSTIGLATSPGSTTPSQLVARPAYIFW
jgi:hypothetical protein